MTLLDKIIHFDKALFIYLNGLGNEKWDGFWMIATNQFSWIPLFLFFLLLIYKSYGWKKLLLYLVIIALLVTFSDQFVNFIKNFFERLRPNRDPSVMQVIRIVKNSADFSFVSGHATSSMAVTLFLYLTLKNYYKYALLFFIWPLVFAYSRIYVGVHFPIDIICGALLGTLIGTLFYRLSLKVFQKFENI